VEQRFQRCVTAALTHKCSSWRTDSHIANRFALLKHASDYHPNGTAKAVP